MLIYITEDNAIGMVKFKPESVTAKETIEVDAESLEQVYFKEDGSIGVYTLEELEANNKQDEILSKALQAANLMGDEEAQQQWLQDRIALIEPMTDEEYEELRKQELIVAKVKEAEDAIGTKEDIIVWMKEQLK